MKEITNLVEETLKEQMENGSIKKIVEDAISNAIKDSVRNALNYNSKAKKYLDEELNNIMLNVIRDTDFAEYVEKIKYVINKALPETALPEYKEFVDGLQKKLGTNTNNIRNVTIKEIFKQYCEFIKSITFNIDDFEDRSDVEDGSAYVNCEVELKQEEGKYSWEYKEYLEFKNDVDDSYNVKVYIKRWTDGDITFRNEYSYSDITHMNEFKMYLLSLENHWTKIILDAEYLEDDVSVEVEY